MNTGTKQQLEQSLPTEKEQIRTALSTHWHRSAVGDANAEHDAAISSMVDTKLRRVLRERFPKP